MPEDIYHYEVALYNKDQMYLPNPKIFGTDMIRIQLPDSVREPSLAENATKLSYRQDFRITQIHWKALDNSKQRCDDTNTSLDENMNTSACIVEYLEKMSNCSMALKGSKHNQIR